ncbi:EPIDERMAL PATTERNING FACTOR-like protein 1 [Ananas comosus]|uniref:Epidermal patterning factor-like protein n=1 Tax=Ananas comosus TaxID=4615 RepID=A0A199W176_ANACO|nr:EPIDERMAL PATTERNING FACTOR-like protein 1 [Ananas comosus]
MAPPAAAASQQCAFLGHRSYSKKAFHTWISSSKISYRPTTNTAPCQFGIIKVRLSAEVSELVGGERHPGSVNGGEIEESSTLGSRPPSCEHKCGGCVPCLAIQVPTAMDRIELHYSNYEPEGWKCKCGSTFFNP